VRITYGLHKEYYVNYKNYNNNGLSKLGKLNHRWRGGVTSDKSGYILVKSINHPYADKNGYVRRSHLIMEKIIGRFILPKEIVHHKNGITNDDRPTNLSLFLSQSHHISHHWKEIGFTKTGLCR